jgi:hypothetical protein
VIDKAAGSNTGASRHGRQSTATFRRKLAASPFHSPRWPRHTRSLWAIKSASASKVWREFFCSNGCQRERPHDANGVPNSIGTFWF